LIVGLSILILRREPLLRGFTVSPGLSIAKCFLPAFLIDVHLKLAKFQPRLGQTLLELILPREQKLPKIVSIGGELCRHGLVRHGDSHAKRA
jgi:hypothetical protein